MHQRSDSVPAACSIEDDITPAERFAFCVLRCRSEHDDRESRLFSKTADCYCVLRNLAYSTPPTTRNPSSLAQQQPSSCPPLTSYAPFSAPLGPQVPTQSWQQSSRHRTSSTTMQLVWICALRADATATDEANSCLLQVLLPVLQVDQVAPERARREAIHHRAGPSRYVATAP